MYLLGDAWLRFGEASGGESLGNWSPRTSTKHINHPRHCPQFFSSMTHDRTLETITTRSQNVNKLKTTQNIPLAKKVHHLAGFLFTPFSSRSAPSAIFSVGKLKEELWATQNGRWIFMVIFLHFMARKRQIEKGKKKRQLRMIMWGEASRGNSSDL